VSVVVTPVVIIIVPAVGVIPVITMGQLMIAVVADPSMAGPDMV
jgi:hypothetical protein